ncbi:MAG: helix-turn-helix domain-containing protein [Opitutus sp.]|nr:helix-turn-helix domain-containing protein [Opitutus sp.]
MNTLSQKLRKKKIALIRGRITPARVTEILPDGRGGITRRALDPATWREKQAKDYAQRVKVARRQLGLTQDQFALLLGVPRGTLRNWEQNHREPSGAAKVLIEVARVSPEAVKAAMNAA